MTDQTSADQAGPVKISSIEEDTHAILRRICAETNQSEETVKLMAYTHYEAMIRGMNAPRVNAKKRLPAHPDSGIPRNLSNGVHTFEIRSCSMDNKEAGTLLLRHIERDRPFDLCVGRAALAGIAQTLSRRLNTTINDTSQFSGHQINVVVYNGRPTRLVDGTPLTF